MLFTSPKQKKFSRLRRAPGFYWVRYSYGGTRQWRIGEYIGDSIGWTLAGDQRFFHDVDFLEINERRVPRYWFLGTINRWWLWALLALLAYNFLTAGFDFYKLIKLMVK